MSRLAVPLHLSSRIILLGGVGRSGLHLPQRCGRVVRLLSPRAFPLCPTSAQPLRRFGTLRRRIQELNVSCALLLDCLTQCVDFAVKGPNWSVRGSSVESPALLKDALLFWIGVTHRAYFGPDIEALGRGAELPRTSRLRRLTPFLDEAGTLRVGGRLRKSSLDYDCKHPAVLPRYSALSQLLIEQAHMRTLHGGTQSTLALFRQNVWIVGGRAPVRSFIMKCVQCVRHRGSTLTQRICQL